jgi:sulfite exporter TauE/SafE
MSTAALIAGAGILGLAGAAHCTAMCAAPCAAVCSRGQASGFTSGVFQLARVIGYAAAGAVVGAGVSALTAWGGALSRGLQPLWLLLHLAVFWCGLWLLVRGRQPEWLERLLRPVAGAREHSVALPMTRRAQIGPQATAALTGLSWVAWPCGLLQAALLLAALADDGFGGAAVMAVFASASSPGLIAAPWIWRRLRGRGGADNSGPSIAWALRGSGTLLAGASLWALAHDSYMRALCGF